MLASSDVVDGCAWCSKCGELHDDAECKVHPLARVHHPDTTRAVGSASSASSRPLPASAVTIRSSVCLSVCLLFCSSVSFCLALRTCGARGEQPLRWRARSGDARSLVGFALSLSCPCRPHHDLLTRCASRCAPCVSLSWAPAQRRQLPLPFHRLEFEWRLF